MSDRSYSSYDDFDDDTWTPLYYAAINNYIDATKLLLELGADPRYKYKDPMTGRICGKLSPPNITHWRLDIYDGGCDGY